MMKKALASIRRVCGSSPTTAAIAPLIASLVVLTLGLLPAGAVAEMIPATDTGKTQRVWTAGIPAGPNIYYTATRDPREPADRVFSKISAGFCRAAGRNGLDPFFHQNWNARNCNYPYQIDVNVNDPAPESYNTCNFQCDPTPVNFWAQITAYSNVKPVYECPANQNWTLSGAYCIRPDCTGDLQRDPSTGICKPPDWLKDPMGGNCTGNPVNAATGLKYQVQGIFENTGGGGVDYRIEYANRVGAAIPAGTHGTAWLGSYERTLVAVSVDSETYVPTTVVARRPGGASIIFRRQVSGAYLPDSDRSESLQFVPASVSVPERWLLLDRTSNAIEEYGSFFFDTAYSQPSTLLRSVNHAQGGATAVLADANGFAGIINRQTGRYVLFQKDAQGRVKSAAYAGSPDSVVIEYDGANNLSKLTWPDSSSRAFLYEDGRWPNHLTGIVDEKGARYASWGYDAQGRAVNSQHAGGAEEVSINYAATSSIDTDARGTARVRQLSTVQGIPRTTSISQPGGAGCAAASSTIQYDANANVVRRDDFASRRVCSAFDLARNLESTRVEGLATSAVCTSLTASGAALPLGSRKISTRWHPDWNLPTARAEPLKLTTWVYNGQPDPFAGNAIATCAPASALLPDGKVITPLCRMVEQATTDANGSTAFSAVLQAGVTRRESTWTYNAAGQVLTATTPGTGTTTSTYHATSSTGNHVIGDLESITNAVGHKTRFTRYDGAGRVLQWIEPNGAVVDQTYNARGSLKTSAVTPPGGGPALTASYQYDPVGQLEVLTLPNGSTIRYRYDDAHRLVGVTDQGGNKVDYVLDSRGNRVSEEFRDASDVIAQRVTRTFDALNRLERVSGASQ
jgi:YD repeat-containing protein